MEEKKKITSFKDLIVWQKSVYLTKLIYETTSKFPKEETYGLTSQMRRAAVSVSSNIAEGFKRRHRREKVQFYRTSLGSLSEIESQTEIAKMLNYINDEDYNNLIPCISDTSKLLERFIYSANNKL